MDTPVLEVLGKWNKNCEDLIRTYHGWKSIFKKLLFINRNLLWIRAKGALIDRQRKRCGLIRLAVGRQCRGRSPSHRWVPVLIGPFATIGPSAGPVRRVPRPALSLVSSCFQLTVILVRELLGYDMYRF